LLYGSTLSTGVTGYGSYFTMQVASKVMDPSYGDDDQLISKHARWFKAMAFEPLMNQDTLNEAKAQVASGLLRDLDQPSKYAQLQAFKALGEEETIAINLDGDLESLGNITLESMVAFHQQVIETSMRHLYVIGNITQEVAIMHYQHQLLTSNHTFTYSSEPLSIKNKGTHSESKVSTQSQMVKILKTNVTMDHPMYLANRVAIAAFGQLPTSLLFMEVREKRSLCYSISSQYIAFDGLCLVRTGIDQSNIELVDKLIDQQVEALKKVDESLLKQAKTMLINAINTSEDELLSFINLHYAYHLMGQRFNKEDVISNIEAITTLDIHQAVSMWEPLLVYVVKGEINHENNS
jgi:predicted Zn-dependent peptidase